MKVLSRVEAAMHCRCSACSITTHHMQSETEQGSHKYPPNCSDARINCTCPMSE
jgi:hypothetical protein